MTTQKIIIDYEEYESIEYLTEGDQELINEGFQASLDAYAPYSGFYVGAAIRTRKNQLIRGYNQENASYPCGICAERAAIHNFGIQNREDQMDCLAVVVRSPVKEIPFPCGFCRQVLVEAEIANKGPIKLLLGNPGSKILVFKSSLLLLPFSFHKGFLHPV